MSKMLMYAIWCLPTVLWAQVNDKACECASDFAYVVHTIETNYVGYADKIAGKEAQLAAHTRYLQSRAETEQSTAGCLMLVQHWLDFFDDKHMRVELSHLPFFFIQKVFRTADSVCISEEEFRAYLYKKERTRKKTPPAPEGIWHNAAGDLWLGIRKDSRRGNTFTGFILQADSLFWLPRQVKMRLTATTDGYHVHWTHANHLSTTCHAATLTTDTLCIHGLQALYRTSAQTPLPPRSRKPVFVPADVQQLDSQTVLLTLRSFDIRYKTAIDSVLNARHSLLSQTPNLIIDIRGNRGGLTTCFDRVMPYLYTQPIVIDGYTMLATTQNIRLYTHFSYHPDIPPSRRKQIWQQISWMKTHEGHLTPMRLDTTVHMRSAGPFPVRVAVLTDSCTASSAEVFVLRARQSTKVKIFGQPTTGAVDYVDKLLDRQVPSHRFGLAYPMTKTSRLVKQPSASACLMPDVCLPVSTDWLAYIRNCFQQPSW